MASNFHPAAMSAAIASRQPFSNPVPVPVPTAPAGTFAPGTKVQVGSHRVVIQKYLSEGGFAHVYLVKLPQAVNGEDEAVLKRVAVPDKEQLANMRTEVETMKKLKGHRHIVTYFDSHASQLQGGGYEVFLLMEYCNGGGLIDFMNTRLQHRLTEPEILNIFSDVAEGVACMHYLKPPLLHRDLKVENVLINVSKNSRRYKLCDFGSTAAPRPAATSAQEGRLIEEDVQRHTTLQYRSPEMIDVYRKQPINEKSDIWALGVLLYKLCYYTTPFEEQGQMSILTASFRFPNYPSFSDRIKRLIASMLREKPAQRPNIYQVICEVCSMRGTTVPIKDIYSGQAQPENRRNQQLPSPELSGSPPPIVGGVFQAPAPVEKQVIPDIVPMRRGRPSNPSPAPASKPSPSPLRDLQNDPFAALDAKPMPGDELSARFPTLDQFALMHDTGNKFEFDHAISSSPPKPDHISQKVTNALADEAFARVGEPQPPEKPPRPTSMQTAPRQSERPGNVKDMSKAPGTPPVLYQPQPTRPSMVSVGTMTTPSSSPGLPLKDTGTNSRPIYRFPPADTHQRSTSQPRTLARSLTPVESDPSKKRPGLSEIHTKSQTQINIFPAHQSPASSRPSLEGSRPTNLDVELDLSRSKSANSKARPTSLLGQSSLGFFRSRTQPEMDASERSRETSRPSPSLMATVVSTQEDANIESDLNFLRAKEEEEAAKKREKRNSSGSKHIKRGSLSSISLSGTKTLLSGRFGDAFRRFETNSDGSTGRPASPSPDRDRRGGSNLPPIEGSEATDDRSDDALDETEDVSPEMRRELERRRLSQEEKRVAKAAEEYRQRLAAQGQGGPARQPSDKASRIQNKVQSLLSESNRSPPRKTAEGYGRYTDKPLPVQPSLEQNTTDSYHDPTSRRPPTAQSYPIPIYRGEESIGLGKPISQSPTLSQTRQQPLPSATPAALPQRLAQRPSAPPKPQKLRTGSQITGPSGTSINPSPQSTYPPTNTSIAPSDEFGAGTADDWESAFSKKYPSLSGIEMVETEIERARGPAIGGGRIRDV
ncbi:MAG: hypothetical protein M1834_009673 [Cirrosporium novae-zelandiae]|nr:MAG: hypothetical protein M1834_009673 [Cirrosporium novae-zelandiae]